MKPQLLKVTESGATIHTYDIPGGKKLFKRFLSCYLGECKFCNDLDEANAYISAMEAIH